MSTENEWHQLDELVRQWWEKDRTTATAADVAADESGTLLPLPRPYSTAGGSESAFPEMYGWDTHFINLGMLAHGRTDLVADHIENQLQMIEDYGMVLNGNRTYYLTRSHPPLLADSVWRYLSVVDDPAMLERSIKMLTREYEDYWCAPHHSTSTPLATNRDLGDPRLRPELSSEAETGLDFTPIFGGDVRRCVPLMTNACLVRTADVLADLHEQRGAVEQSSMWRRRAQNRASTIRELCWNQDTEFFYEYDTIDQKQLIYRSLNAYWMMWAGVATAEQAEALVRQLVDFRTPNGLCFTDRAYPSPHPEFSNLQWQYPAGWPPMQIIVVQGLQRYGYEELAREVARDFVDLQVRIHQETGSLWERYDVVAGSANHPGERYTSVRMHGWSSASVAALGRVAYYELGNE